MKLHFIDQTFSFELLRGRVMDSTVVQKSAKCSRQRSRYVKAFLRASNYYRMAVFFLAPDDSRRMYTFEKSRIAFWQFLELFGLCVEGVCIPYEGTMLPGYFYRVDASNEVRPTLVALGGFDSTGEELYFFPAAAALQRGYNVLTFEGPGQGEPLRVEYLPARHDYEFPVGAAVDYLLSIKKLKLLP